MSFFDNTGAIYEDKGETYLGRTTNIKTMLAGNAVEWARIEFKETWDAKAPLKILLLHLSG